MVEFFGGFDVCIFKGMKQKLHEDFIFFVEVFYKLGKLQMVL